MLRAISVLTAASLLLCNPALTQPGSAREAAFTAAGTIPPQSSVIAESGGNTVLTAEGGTLTGTERLSVQNRYRRTQVTLRVDDVDRDLRARVYLGSGQPGPRNHWLALEGQGQVSQPLNPEQLRDLHIRYELRSRRGETPEPGTQLAVTLLVMADQDSD